jgi:hypothetical protein
MICHDCDKEEQGLTDTSYGSVVCNQCLEDYYFCSGCCDYFYESDFGQHDLCLVCEKNEKGEV